MTWSLIFFFNNILLGVGLAMDAFSVSVANCLHEPKMRLQKMCAVAGTFAAFQAIMPMAGWLCVRTVVQFFGIFQKFIPWIALALLSYIGGKMLIEGIREKKIKDDCDIRNTTEACEIPPHTKLTFSALMLQGIATSIDALSVGFTIADYNAYLAVVASLIIAGVTFVICIAGCFIGKKFGDIFSNKATILGGIILIVIGIEIFAKGIFLK